MSIAVPIELIINQLKPNLEDKLKNQGGFGFAKIVQNGENNLDDTTKIVIFDKNNIEAAFLLCSFSKFGTIPTRNSKKSAEIKKNLGEELGSVLLEPIISGEVGGVDYAVWPYCQPLKSHFISRKFQMLQLKPIIFSWLRDATKVSMCEVSESELQNNFINPLKRLAVKDKIRKDVKNEISFQIKSLEEQDWKPFFVLAHNDLWQDNILVNTKNTGNPFHGLTIIDWAGANYNSFAMYDLVRLALSLDLSKHKFKHELVLHCEILGCNKRDSLGYLLASFAFLAENLDQFPEDMFIKVVHESFDYLRNHV
jgi:hypothetical protein